MAAIPRDRGVAALTPLTVDHPPQGKAIAFGKFPLWPAGHLPHKGERTRGSSYQGIEGAAR